MTRRMTGVSRYERFIAKTWPADDGSGCLLWTAALNDKGYGIFQESSRRSIGAHRWLWIYVNGPVPEPLVLDHLCRNRACVNPLHLEPVTLAENSLRGTAPPAVNARKTRCKRGHELVVVESGKRRRCVECAREAKRRYKARNPERRRAEYKAWYDRHSRDYHRARRARLKAEASSP